MLGVVSNWVHMQRLDIWACGGWEQDQQGIWELENQSVWLGEESDWARGWARWTRAASCSSGMLFIFYRSSSSTSHIFLHQENCHQHMSQMETLFKAHLDQICEYTVVFAVQKSWEQMESSLFYRVDVQDLPSNCLSVVSHHWKSAGGEG